MSEVEFVPLSAFADISMGQSPGSDTCNREGKGLPFLQGCAEFGPRNPTTEIFCSPPLRVGKADSVLISVRAPVGTMNYADQDYCIGRGLAAFKAKANCSDIGFLKHAVELNSGFLHRRSQGSTFAAVSSSDVRNIPIPNRPFHRQQKIAAILTSIDTTIEKTEALIEKYQQIKAGLMHDLFTRGVLPNGQLRPPREQAPELYQETPIGVIPKVWSLVRAGDLCSLVTKGTTPPQTAMWDGQHGVRFLRVDNLTFDGQFDFEASSYRISPETNRTILARSVCVPGDVLMNIVGPPLGKVAHVTTTVGEVNINQAIAVFRPRAELSALFLLRWLISDTAKRWILQRAKQTSGQLNVTLAMCQDLLVPHISLEEQHLIEQRIQGVDALLRLESDRLSKLGKQKLGLMQDLLTGKVSVKVGAGETANHSERHP